MASPNLPGNETTASPLDPGKLAYPHTTWDSAILYGGFSLLLFAPLAFGGVEDWAIFVLQVGSISLFLAWAIGRFRAQQITVSWNPLFGPMLAFGVLVGVQLALRTSAYQHATFHAALLYAAYGLLVFVIGQSLRRTADLKRLVRVLMAYGSGMALFAIIQSLSSNGKLYWVRTPRSGGWIYGPYVNHNHYAGLMEMLFPIALVAALNRYVRGKWKMLSTGAAVLMVSTIFLSGSRGGMIAFLVQLVLLGTLIGGEKNRRTALTVAMVLTVVASLLLWVGGEALVSRIGSIPAESETELAGGLRLTIDRDGLTMFAKRPVLGWGLGTFPTVYPQFRTFYTDKFINEAHDDYLQLAVETGILGFLVMVWFMILLFRHSLQKLNDWTSDYNGAAGLAALLGCTGILVHSFIDFNLQIPANAAFFYTLCALAAAPTDFTVTRRLRRQQRRQAGEHPLSQAQVSSN